MFVHLTSSSSPSWFDSWLQKQFDFEENYILSKVIVENKELIVSNYRDARTLEIYDLVTSVFFCGTILTILVRDRIQNKIK